MNMNINKAAGLVFIPSFGVGHVASSIQFANLLVNRHDNLWITILIMKLPYDNSHAAAYTDSLNSPRLHLINLPEPSSNSMQTPMDELLQLQKPLIKQAVSNLTPAPPLAAFVLDMFCITMIDVAKEFHVPSLVFFTSGLSYLGLILHLYTLREEKGEFTEYGTEVVIPIFPNPVPATVLPFTMLNKEWDSFFVSFWGDLKKADGIIVNSFEELESHAAHSFLDGPQPIYSVGPILNYKPNNGDGDAVTTEILNWLDQQPTSSVVFLCFGSMGSFGEDQVREIARALENSGVRFLWSLRKPSSTLPVFINPSDYAPSELPTVLPPGFLDRTAGIGKVIGWAPQTQILAHPATGAFVSHCGWNSTLESIHFGVPIAAWPLSADQHINAFLLVHHLNIASEISFDYRLDFWARPNTLLTADCIEKGIRNLVEIDEDTRKRVKEASQNSSKTLLEGGSSHSNFERLIDYIMNQV